MQVALLIPQPRELDFRCCQLACVLLHQILLARDVSQAFDVPALPFFVLSQAIEVRLHLPKLAVIGRDFSLLLRDQVQLAAACVAQGFVLQIRGDHIRRDARNARGLIVDPLLAHRECLGRIAAHVHFEAIRVGSGLGGLPVQELIARALLVFDDHGFAARIDVLDGIGLGLGNRVSGGQNTAREVNLATFAFDESKAVVTRDPRSIPYVIRRLSPAFSVSTSASPA